jgi:hypothetical protein
VPFDPTLTVEDKSISLHLLVELNINHLEILQLIFVGFGGFLLETRSPTTKGQVRHEYDEVFELFLAGIDPRFVKSLHLKEYLWVGISSQ